jgi:hypothetical protein
MDPNYKNLVLIEKVFHRGDKDPKFIQLAKVNTKKINCSILILLAKITVSDHYLN